MNRILTGLTAALLIAALALPAAALPKTGTEAPEIALKSLDGKDEITLSGLRGKVVYIDFWASWCPPCKRALPEIMKLHEAYRERGFEVLAVSLDRSADAGLKHMKKIGADFIQAFDAKGEAARSYEVKSIPSGILVDVDGKIVRTLMGFQESEIPELKKEIEELLKDVKPDGK